MEDEVELRLDFEARSTILTGAGVGWLSKRSWGNQGIRPNVVVACNPSIEIGGLLGTECAPFWEEKSFNHG